MPYDPTLPANNSPIVSAELRNQLNGLKELIDGCVTNMQMLITINQLLNDNASANSNSVNLMNLTVSEPPTQGEVQSIADKLDELIQALRR